MLTDPAGAATTYSASSTPVVGTKAVKVTGTVVSVDLRGDNTLLDTDTMLQGVALELDYAKLNLDVIAILLGGTVVDAGTTPSQTSVWTLPNPPTYNYIKLEARSMAADSVLGDFHILFPKVKLSDFPMMGLAEENYQLFNLKMKAVPPNGTPVGWMTVTLNETAVVIT
jgi:hypothetical protein